VGPTATRANGPNPERPHSRGRTETSSTVSCPIPGFSYAAFADSSVSADHANYPVDIAVLPDGRLYVAVITYYYTFRGFSAGGGVVVVDPSGDVPVVTETIPLFSLPGSIALSADGTRAFAGIQAYWADSLYGAAFMPGQWVATIDTASNTTIAWTDLGADGLSFAATHVPAGLAVAPDRSAVFVSVPNIDSLLEISTDSNLVTRRFQFDGAGPTGVAVPPDAAAKPKAFTIEAFDDGPSAPVSAGSAALALASVLANDKVGGAPATTANVTLAVVSASPSLSLDTSTKIASQLVHIQDDNLGIDYIAKRDGLIDAVTIEDARRVAKRLYGGGLLVTVAGRPEGVTSTAE